MVLKSVLKWMGWACAAFSSVIVMLVLIYCAFGYYYTHFVPKSLPVPFGNGFVYADGPNENIEEKVLYNENGDVVVRGDIKEFVIYRDTVYGWRYVFPFVKYYFVCTYGEDCTDSQDYTEQTFNTALEQRGLPRWPNWRIRNQPLVQTPAWTKLMIKGE